MTDVQQLIPQEHIQQADLVAEFIQASRRLIGFWADDVARGTSTADWISIHRFVEATGDENPLYLDAYYGAGSAHGTMLAPPTFVLAVHVPESTGAFEEKPYGLLSFL